MLTRRNELSDDVRAAIRGRLETQLQRVRSRSSEHEPAAMNLAEAAHFAGMTEVGFVLFCKRHGIAVSDSPIVLAYSPREIDAAKAADRANPPTRKNDQQ